MKFKDILENYNVNGEIYRCDIKRYFGWDLSRDKVNEIHRTLTEMVNGN